MKKETIHIRNMCCQRCIDAVRDELKKLELSVGLVILGEATFTPNNKITLSHIETALGKRGFILVKNPEEIVADKISSALFDIIPRLSGNEASSFSLSDYLEEKTKVPYRTLLKIFKKYRKISIEKYFILQKIEKVKELIEQTNLSFSEIAYRTQYKSPQHLSAQFRQITGKTMTEYKTRKFRLRKSIDSI